MVVLQQIVSDSCVPLGMYRRVSIDKALKGVQSAWREVQEQVKEQEEAIRFLVENDPELKKRGAAIVRDYCDNDTPASDPFIVREDFEAMLKDLEAGVIRGFIFLHSDRAARLVYDAARICRVFEMNPDYIGRSVEGGVDLSKVEGRGMFVIQATMGNMEIGNIKRRTTRTNSRIARKGAMHGAPRPFGWADDRKTLHEDEHPFLLKAIRAVPGGLKVGTFRGNLIEFGREPRKTKRSREDGNRTIEHSTAEAILTNPRNAGFRMYAPQDERRGAGRLWLPDTIVRDSKGNPVLGDWAPQCTPDEYWTCVNEIKRRKEARKNGKPGLHDTSVKYLLSGIARCGTCLTPMYPNPYTKGTPSYERYGFRYACLNTQGGCGGVTRVGPPVDDLVESAFLLGTREGLGQAVEKAAEEIDETIHDPRLAKIGEELADVKQRRHAGRISMGESLDAIEELERERDQLQSKRGKLALQKKQKKLLSPEALSDWDKLSMSEKRTRLLQSIRSVVIHPVGRGKRWDPEFIEIVWHEEDAQ